MRKPTQKGFYKSIWVGYNLYIGLGLKYSANTTEQDYELDKSCAYCNSAQANNTVTIFAYKDLRYFRNAIPVEALSLSLPVILWN